MHTGCVDLDHAQETLYVKQAYRSAEQSARRKHVRRCDIPDAAQEVMLKSHSKLCPACDLRLPLVYGCDRFLCLGKIVFKRIADRTAIDCIRTYMKKTEHLENESELPDHHTQALFDFIDSPAYNAHIEEILAAMDLVLTARQRSILLMSFGGLSYREIKEETGLSIGTISRDFSSGRDTLQAHFEREHPPSKD